MSHLLPSPRSVQVRIVDRSRRIRVDEWNRLVERYERNRPLRVETVSGESYLPPWSIAGRWNGEKNRFEFQVKAGFVDGDHVEVSILASDAPERTRERTEASSVEIVDAWLDELPWISIDPERLRAIGTDAIGTELEDVPPYFAALGVRNGSLISIDLEDPGISIEDPGAQGGDGQPRRLLRAVDLVLTKRRPALVTTINEGGGLTRINLSTTSSSVLREFATLSLERKFEPPYRVQGFDELLAGATDDPFDQMRIGTVYLLSPDGSPDGEEPGEDWSIVGVPSVFRNLLYDVDVFLESSSEDVPFSIPGGLGLGAADPLIEFLNESITEEADRALRMLNNSTIKGKFWT